MCRSHITAAHMQHHSAERGTRTGHSHGQRDKTLGGMGVNVPLICLRRPIPQPLDKHGVHPHAMRKRSTPSPEAVSRVEVGVDPDCTQTILEARHKHVVGEGHQPLRRRYHKRRVRRTRMGANPQRPHRRHPGVQHRTRGSHSQHLVYPLTQLVDLRPTKGTLYARHQHFHITSCQMPPRVESVHLFHCEVILPRDGEERKEEDSPHHHHARVLPVDPRTLAHTHKKLRGNGELLPQLGPLQPPEPLDQPPNHVPIPEVHPRDA
mmetsp:Transcript_13751/g.29369  ORF Transcript_13751/g.29369 Transcript_13751/m.29369 type:complete len:264 (-) Transcript_13751:2344-3135(-)